jgi:predicted metal-dependent peptidase
MSEDFAKIEKLSAEVLCLSRNTILINLRFMDVALVELELVPSMLMRGIATDGKHLLYNPIDILKLYAGERYVINRDYLHVLLHCLYRHNFVNERLDEAVWDLACDITVENIINELSISSLDAERMNAQVAVISELKSNLKILTAEKIYRYYLDKRVSPVEIERIRAQFFADDHALWYQKDDGQSDSGEQDGDSNSEDASSDGSGGERDDYPGGEENEDRSLQEERWKEISERMQQDLETFSKDRGDKAGSLMQNLGEVNRERYDYTAFLKKFAVMGEAMKINDDEFDYVFYTYGLKLYKKMPLIEPLEYKDIKRIREFVIVIDTSGSVSGELVQTFINKTYNILKTTESFFSKINLYIIQCDAKIQEVTKITSQEEFDEYLKNLKLKGFGGTDLRPAFELVNNLVESGELARLKGIIYFTDGWGVFPEKKPLYDSAFVFIRQDNFNPNVPPWAIKLVLDKEDI